MEKESSIEHNRKAEGNCKKKEDCLECKLLFHLHTFPCPIKWKELREAWVKAERQEQFDKKKDPGNQLQVIESVSFILSLSRNPQSYDKTYV